MFRDRNHIRQQEIRRRVLFAIKLVLLLVIAYVYVQHYVWLRDQEGLWLHVAKMLLFYLSANLTISLGRTVLVYVYLRSNVPNPKQSSVVLAINRIAALLKGTTFVVACFLLFDLKWNDFFATFSLVAVATVLITKDYISNTINGLINMMADRLSLGDYVKIGKYEGKVVNITLSNVYLVDDEDHLITIPNNTVFSSDIINHNKQRAGRVAVPFEIKPERPLDELEQQLREAMRPHDHLVASDSYELIVKQLATDKIDCIFTFTLLTPNYERAVELKKHLLRVLAQVSISATVHNG